MSAIAGRSSFYIRPTDVSSRVSPSATFTFLAGEEGVLIRNGNVFFDPPRAAEIRNAFANPAESQHDRGVARRRAATCRHFFSNIPDSRLGSRIDAARRPDLMRAPVTAEARESQRVGGLTGALSVLLAFSLADTPS